MNVQDEEFNQAVRNLFHGETMERASAARKLGHFKLGRATNLLIKAIKNEKDPVVINRIIEAMGEIKDAKATLSIIDYLKNEVEKPEKEQDKNRLFLIIESLMKIGDKRALEHLGILLNTCNHEIKALTEEALECIDPNWKNNIKKK
jgi:HEAT repeat protein